MSRLCATSRSCEISIGQRRGTGRDALVSYAAASAAQRDGSSHPAYAQHMTWTPYADLDSLLAELVGLWRQILGATFVGAYVQGSFALGAGDQQSDCDWIVALRDRPTAFQEARLRALHAELPTRAGHWPHDVEGSYAPIAELARVESLGREWLYNDHGQRTLEWDDHCNRAYTRWILREHGIVLSGPTPLSFMPPVPEAALRAEAAAAIPTVIDELATWLDIDQLAWGQRYAVTTVARILYTLDTAAVASKAGALEWAQRTLDPRWRPLLGQVRDDRVRGLGRDDRPRPGSSDEARAFAAYAVDWAATRTLRSR
jgi:Aminoglycoside adenylyltransferase, C-terminal domain